MVKLTSLHGLLSDKLHVLSHLLDDATKLIVLLLQLQDLLIFLIEVVASHFLEIFLSNRASHDRLFLVWGTPLVHHLLLGALFFEAQSVNSIDIKVLEVVDQRIVIHDFLSEFIHWVHVLELRVLLLLGLDALHVLSVVVDQLLPSHVSDNFF